MPDCVGRGVEIPISTDVVVVKVLVVTVPPPSMATQAYVLIHRFVQGKPTAGFHLIKSATLMLYSLVMVGQVLPDCTR